MAYKFQLGDAIMSGALAQEGKFEVLSDINESLRFQIARNTAAVSGSGTMHMVGAATFGGTLATSGNIDTAGDMTAATISMSGFTVDADGDTVVKTLSTPDDGTIGSTTNADLLTLAAAAVTVKSNSDFNVAKTAGLQLGGVAVTSTAAELNKLDGAGADVTAAKLTTLSALTDAEIAFVDGSGTAVVASKVVVADANKDVRTLRSLTGSADAAFANFRASDSFISNVGAKSVSITAGAAGSSLGALTLSGTLSSSAGSTIVGDAVLGGSLSTSGSVKLAGVAAAAVAVASDSLYFLDGDGLMKSESFVDYATALAGDGLSASGGVLALDMNELTEAAVNVAADSLIFIDADGNVTRKDTWADYATAIAGAGITATNGVLSTDAAVVSAAFGDANATLVEGLNFGNATFTADRTLTLPASPSTNDIVRVKAPANLAGFDCVIQKGSADHRIDGQETVILESNGGALTMQYVGADQWLIY
jgi:hypothetical protein